jgi:hypothetical protein
MKLQISVVQITWLDRVGNRSEDKVMPPSCLDGKEALKLKVNNC